jgi:hypothetical protein
MKRVGYYLTGAVGLAPATLGMAIGPAVGRAAAPDVAAGQAKTVSLHHVLGHQATLTAAVSSSANSTPKVTSTSATSPEINANAGDGCVGKHEVDISTLINGSMTIRYWYTKEANDKLCIGTVEMSESPYGGSGYLFRVRIRSRSTGGADRLAYHSSVRGHILDSHAISFGDGVHQEFGSEHPNIQLCGALVKAGTVIIGPICHTVRR